MRGFPFWILVFVLVFSPLPFASVGAIWPQLYGVLLGFGLVAHVAQRWRANRGIPPLPKLPLAAGLLVFVVVLWGYAQSVPGLLPSLHHPFWSQAAALLELPDMQGYLSLDPQQSFQVATRYLVYLSFALLVLWYARCQRNAELLLKIFVAAQGAYAVYGLAIYFSSLETILWFDKTAYRGVLTSTFVNRNSYATYAGLGVLTALALTLRFLRRTLSRDTSHRTKLRELIEVLTTTGWLLPVILVACFVAILLTESRMGLIACMIASAVLVGGWVSRLPAGQARTFGSLLLVVLLSFLAFNLLLSGGMTADRLARFFEQGDGRFDVYPLVWQAISERPWTGYGLGAFESAFRAFRDASVGAFFTRAHSDYLELIMDVGWPAALAMFSAFILLLAAAWRASRMRGELELALLSVAATVQIGVHSVVDFSMQMPAVVLAYLAVALAGLGYPKGASASRSAPAMSLASNGGLLKQLADSPGRTMQLQRS